VSPRGTAGLQARYDAVVVGGGHNGLAAAAYLAGAGRSVLVLEALDHLGGAAVSAQVFEGVDARLSRYSYLVSLLPRQVVDELGLSIALRRRRFSSYTPVPGHPDGLGLLIDNGDAQATAASFRAVSGGGGEHAAWVNLYATTGRLAQRMFPTVTEPLLSAAQMRAVVGDDAAWDALVEQPLGEMVAERFLDDTVAGVVLTDALIGTFAAAGEASLQQNRCFLYHVIGGGTGDWDVPVGGMGSVSGALETAALRAGATVLTRARVLSVDPGSPRSSAQVTWTDADGREHAAAAGHVLAGCAPSVLARLLGEDEGEPVEGAQLKVNMLLRRLPRLREDVDPVAAFSGTFHINESAAQLQSAFEQADAGRIPNLPPCEIYCHSLSDGSILGADLLASGATTLTLFGLHMPTRLFLADNDSARAQALAATLRSLDSVLAEPIEDCLLLDAQGRPCLEARTPLDVQADVRLPGGNIFQRPLQWPWAESAEDVGRWGVETHHSRVLLAGAGARRGGGVSAIAGRSAAMAALGR